MTTTGSVGISVVEWFRRLRVCLLFFLLATAFPATAMAQAPSDAPMRFVVVRSSAPGCEPVCPEWISAEGAIVAKTPGQLKNFLKTLGKRKLPIVVSSPGGDVEAALALGRIIRKNKLDTAVGRTMFDRCKPEDDGCKANEGRGARYLGLAYAYSAVCNSACPLMFAGGVRRVVGQWAFLGVHQVTTTFVRTQLTYRTKYKVVNGRKRILEKKVVSRKTAGSYKTYEMNSALERKLAAYLKEMGVDAAVLDAMKKTPATDIRQLPPYYMLRWGLISSLDEVGLLTKVDICKTVPAADNCRLFTVADVEP